MSISVSPSEINKKIVYSFNEGAGFYLNCGVNSKYDLCINNTYAKLDGTSQSGIITRYSYAYNKNIDQNLGIPEQPYACNIPQTFIGNPINFSIGNKFQVEQDTTGFLPFIRYYNSLNENKNNLGMWTNNYSTHLDIIKYNESTTLINIVKSDGGNVPFYVNNGITNPTATELGTLKKVGDGYQYISQFHEVFDFDATGRLTHTVSNGGIVHNIKHLSGTEFVVSDEFGHSLTIIETKDYQPLLVKSSDGITVTYTYDGENRLVKMTKDGKSRTYHYEDELFPRALTGITDKNGIRYVTWTYDDKGRANSSAHAGGKDKVSITYNSDTQTTLTNPLGRKYTYYFQVIDGVKRITSISSSSSSLCPAIGSNYRYNAHGLVTSKTDGKGIVTQYDYNDAGQETSRTIGSTLTIKTTWDSRFFDKPKTETYPDKEISYSYDNNGNLINQTLKTLN